MSVKSVSVDQSLAKEIKKRRNELGLTIEEAAKFAGVGTKTWSRYEAGESIRQDKCKGVCKALKWLTLPTDETGEDDINLSQYKNHEAWSVFLEHNYGVTAATSFAVGSDILLDCIKEDLGELSKLPKGTHIGQIETSYIKESLPAQFLMEYDYNFLYSMYAEILRLRMKAHYGQTIVAHSVLDELILRLIVEESHFLIDIDKELGEDEYWDEWIYDMFPICFWYGIIYMK